MIDSNIDRESLPEKINDLFDTLKDLENLFKDYFKEKESFWDGSDEEIAKKISEPFGGIGKRRLEESEINVIPTRYGRKTNRCYDTLLVIMEPSIYILTPNECYPDIRMGNRINDALKHIRYCENLKIFEVKYIIFWAGFWDFKLWNKYRNDFQGKHVFLVPWFENPLSLI
jgi:hypothetical protein